VIALDDLHAADTPSLLLLRFVVRELAAMHVLLLAAFRDVDPVPGQALTALLADVAREPAATRLSPPGLSESDVARYVERAASEIASPELAAALYAETEGNPLFVGESVRVLCVDGVPMESTGEVRLAMPQSVRDVIAVRLDRLSDACSEVLGHASVLGREFALDVLARMGELRGEDLLARLDEAARARIVSDVPGSPGRLRFEHVLFRDSLYEGLSPMRRIGLHRRAGEALAVLSADEPGLHLAELAHHWIAGCDFERGLDYARRAAQRALVLLAYEEAARLYQVALTALDRSHAGGDTLRCDLLLALGDAQSLAGQGPTARETFLQAAAVARNMRSPERLSRAALGYAGRDIWGPRAEGEATLVPLLREALAACPDGEDQLRARLLARLATSLRGALDRGQPASLADQAVEIASRVGDRSTLLTALGARLVATRGPENVAESVADARAVIELAEELGDPERAFGGHEDLSYSLWVLGDRSSMVAEVGEMTRLARELRQPAREWAVTAHHAMSALSAGQLAAAGELIETAFRLGEQSESWPAVASHRLQTFLLRELRGELRGYVDVLRDSLGEYPGYRIFECALAHACFELGREAEAREAFEHLAEDDFRRLSRDEDWLVNVCLLSDVCVYLGDAKRAAVLYRLVSPFAALNAVASAEIDLGAAARSVAGLAVALGRYDEAASHFDTALELNSRMGAWPWLAHTQHGYGRMLLLRDEPDDRSKARDLLAQALATYRELGLDRYVDRCLEPATRLGVSTGG